LHEQRPDDGLLSEESAARVLAEVAALG